MDWRRAFGIIGIAAVFIEGIAGAWIQRRKSPGARFREQALALFRDVDILIARACSSSAAAFRSNPCLSVSSIRTPQAR